MKQVHKRLPRTAPDQAQKAPAGSGQGPRRTIAERNRAAIALLEEWLRDDSGYDERTWNTLKQDIERNRLSNRRRFRG